MADAVSGQLVPDRLVPGQLVPSPVEVRQASSVLASCLAPAGAVQELIGYSSLQVASPLPGRALVSVGAITYVDSDLGAYHEVAVAFAVRPHDAPGGAGPADGSPRWPGAGWPPSATACPSTASSPWRQAAGSGASRSSWPRRRSSDRAGRPSPPSTRATSPSWSCGSSGASLQLGERHPMAVELRSLCLPRRALFSSTVGHLAATFADAQVVTLA
ncbi:hypothetical protein BH24ACT3_BH24ACT3_09480 [soil metagenome]